MWLIKNNVPYGYGDLKWQYGSWWVVNVMAGRVSPRGTGKKILRLLTKEAKRKYITDLRLGTNFDNITMLMCALHSGYRLLGTDRNGYILEKSI